MSPHTSHRRRKRLLLSALSGIVACIAFLGGVAGNLVASDLDRELGSEYRPLVWAVFAIAAVAAISIAVAETKHQPREYRLADTAIVRETQVSLTESGHDATRHHLHPLLPNPTSFLGREAEIQALMSMLHKPGQKVVLLYGVAGFGKSMLAAYVARKMVGNPFTTVIWGNIRPDDASGVEQLISSFEVVVAAVSKGSTELQRQAAVLEYMRSTPTLLICDNMENLTSEVVFQQMGTFFNSIDSTTGSRVLLVSRRNDSWLYKVISQSGSISSLHLEGLDVTTSVDLLQRQGARVQQLATATFSDLAPLAAAAFYNPKLIELLVGLGDFSRIKEAAARLPSSLRETRQSLLSDAFAILQETPGALILLQYVSIFVPSADYASLQAICGPNLPIDADLETALDVALSTALLTRNSTSTAGTLYYLHAIVQGYLSDTAYLRPPDELIDQATAAHSAYFARFTLEHADVNNEVHKAALLVEWENIQVGWRRAEARRQSTFSQRSNKPSNDEVLEAARWITEYAMGLRTFVMVYGLWREGQDLLVAGIEAAQQLGNNFDRIALLKLMNNLAWIIGKEGNLARARALYMQSLELCKRDNDIQNAAWALHEIGRIDMLLGDLPTARAEYEQSVHLSGMVSDVQTNTRTLHMLALLEALEGNIPHARYQLEQCLKIQHQISDMYGVALTLHELGTLDAQAGKADEARKRFEVSLQISRQLGNVVEEARNLHTLGCLARAVGQLTEARHNLERSLQMRKQIGDVAGEAETQLELGRLLFNMSHSKEGLAMLHSAVRVYEQLKMPRELAEARSTLQEYEQ